MPVRLDVRGMRCPWPAVRLGRAMREDGGPVLILADDPIAPGEIAALAAARGWTVRLAEEPTAWIVTDGARQQEDSTKV